jgi:hypothetical protein
MKKLFFLILIVMTIFITACNNDEAENSTDYIIFGYSYGECQGEDCIKYFKVDQKGVYEYDDNCLPTLISSCVDTNPTKLSDDKFDIAITLFNNFPTDLYDESGGTLGCPDCHDQGALYLQISSEDDGLKDWNIDQDKNAIPTYLHTYVDKINEVIEEM